MVFLYVPSESLDTCKNSLSHFVQNFVQCYTTWQFTCQFTSLMFVNSDGRDIVVGIQTRYMFDGSGFESRCRK